MKNFTYLVAGICTCMSLSGCGLMEMSFRAGFLIALILAAIIGLLIWILHIAGKIAGKYFPAIRANFQGFWNE
jgi:hypothetical protein